MSVRKREQLSDTHDCTVLTSTNGEALTLKWKRAILSEIFEHSFALLSAEPLCRATKSFMP